MTVSKWGNSLGIRVPKDVAADLHLSEGSTLVIEPQNGGYLIRASGRAPITRYKLTDLVAGMTKADREPRELDWGLPQGSEDW